MESKEHPTTTWPMKTWFFEKTHEDSSDLETHVQSRVKCATRKSARVCVRWSICLHHVHGSCHCLDAKLPEKISRLQMEVQSITTMTRSCCWRLCTSLLVQVEVEDRDVVIVVVYPTILCLAILECASLAIDGPKMKNSTTPSFLSMSRMKTMWNTLASGNSTTQDVVGLLDPMCHCVLFALLLECEVLLCLELVEGWQDLVLMIYNQVVDTVVLLVNWNQRLSKRQYCYIVLVVGKVHYSWCQSRRCNRGTWHTSPSIRSLPETLGILCLGAIGPVRRCICSVSVLTFLHPWPCDDRFAMDYVHFFSLSTGLPWFESMEFSTLQKLLWFVPSYFAWVEARQRIDTRSIPLVRASGKKDTELSPMFVSIRLTPLCPFSKIARLVSWLKIFLPVDKSLPMDFAHDPMLNCSNCSLISSSSLHLVGSHLEILLLFEDRFRIVAFCQQVAQGSVKISLY